MNSWNTIIATIGNYLRPSTDTRRPSKNSSRRDGRSGEGVLHSPPTSSRESPSSAVEPRSRGASSGRSAGTRQQGTSRSAEIIQRDLQKRAEELALELDRVKKELSLTKQELESNRVFTNKADPVSEADIITKLGFLNDAVYQIASAIAEASISTDTPEGTAPQFTVAEADENRATRVSTDIPSKRIPFFDESICSLVRRVRHKPTHPSVLVSLQACMNHFCTMVLSSEFSSIVNRERTELLQQIFDVMKVKQPKAVSARWRSLAYSHNHDLTHDQQKLHQLLVNGIRTLFGFPKDGFESKFGQELSELVAKTLDLRTVMYRDYVSGDVKVFSPVPGSQFDPQKMQVDDPRSNGRSSAAGPIMCTTTMGIARTLYIRRLRADKWIDIEEYNVLGKANVLMSFDD